MHSPKTVPNYVAIEKYVADFLNNPEQVDLFITNAPFMTLTQLSKLFNCYDYMVIAIASAINVPINSAYTNIPLACIISRLKVLSPEAVIKHVSRGTLVILPDDGKYVRTVHHFSDGHKDRRVAIKSRITDLPPHLQTKTWSEPSED